jgi:lipid-A-disaccharide synthase
MSLAPSFYVMTKMKNKHILIVAGEASGDLHGANLVREIKKIDPSISIRGIGGRKMEEAGVDIVMRSSEIAVVGLTEVFSKYSKILKARREMVQLLESSSPDLLILIDFPGFNINLARSSKRCHVPVLYYISPQLWAWRSGRAKKIAARVDRMAVILPFEEEFYKKTGVDIDVEYVGHPLMDAVPSSLEKDTIKKDLGLETGLVLGLLPGSRTAEITNLLPSMIQAAEMLAARHPDIKCVLPLASTISRELIDSYISKSSLKIIVPQKDVYSILSICDLALIKSGTATLEAAIMGVPMVVAYRMSALSFKIAKLVIKVANASLVNLIAGKEIVPELLQDDATPEKLAERASKILDDEFYRNEMIKNLEDVRKKLGGRGASEKTAKIALEMINKKRQRE